VSTANLPALDDAEAWKKHCLGSASHPGTEPSATFVQSLDQVGHRHKLSRLPTVKMHCQSPRQSHEEWAKLERPKVVTRTPCEHMRYNSPTVEE